MQSLWYESPAVWSYGVSAGAFGSLALLLSMRWRGELRSAFLLAAVVLSAFWAATSASHAVTESTAMWTTTSIFDGLRIFCFIGFLFLLFGRADEGVRGIGGRAGFYVLLAALATLGALAIGTPEPGRGQAGLPATAILLFLSIVGLAAAEQLYRHTPAVLRWNVRPVCIALGALFVYDLVMYADALLFRMLDATLWTARGFTHALVVPVLGIAATRNRDWSFDVALSRGVLVGSTAVFGSATYLLGIAALGYYVRYFGGHWGRTIAIVLGFGAVLFLALVVLSGTFRSKLRVLIAKNFFAYRYDYREEWLAFTGLISAPAAGSSINAQCIAAIGNLVETASGALWLLRDGAYLQLERSTFGAVTAALPIDSSLPRFLRGTGWVVDIPEARAYPERYRGLELPDWLQSMENAWLVVPLVFGDELMGFIVLGRPRVGFELDWEVRDLLKTAGRQAASYLAQAQATEMLIEARKFDAFNRMSAFVVHDLKNLVAQLQLMLRNAERHAGNPDFQRDMLMTVEHVVGRMNALMLQLRAGAQPIERAHAVDLGGVARRIKQVRAAGRARFVVETEGGVVALGHEERLERVIGHLVQNAFDASAADAEVRLRVLRDGAMALVEVTDQGAGMTPEFIRDRLFKPFNSTKQMGMGIGSYESHQYVAGIGGRIEVESEPGAGTTIRVRLPLAEQRADARVAA